MTNKEFDDILKQLLENYEAEYIPGSWEFLQERLDAGEEIPDEALRAMLSGYAVDEKADWDVMERILEASSDPEFDQAVKSTVNSINPEYDPGTWPSLNAKIEADERLRRRIVGSKVLEIVALLIILLTVFNLYPDVRRSIIDSKDDQGVIASGPELNSHGEIETSGMRRDDLDQAIIASPDAQTEETGRLAGQHGGDLATASASTSTSDAVSASEVGSTASNPELGGSSRSRRMVAAVYDLPPAGMPQAFVEGAVQTNTAEKPSEIGLIDEQAEQSRSSFNQPVLSSVSSSIATPLDNVSPELVSPSLVRKGSRIGFAASWDVNALYIPSNQFETNNTPVYFGEKTLLATGYSVGASYLLDRGAWTFETGLFYSLKSYEPNRIIKIGQTFDFSTIDFQKISLHTVHLPLLAHWNFDRKGSTRFYVVAGGGLNVVATAHYDLIVRNDTRSPSGGSRPSRRAQEIQEVREHLLDGAVFSSKSFITFTGGFGVEQIINPKFSVFLQPTYNHQIPLFKISDLDGKHLRYFSMQVGTRVRLK